MSREIKFRAWDRFKDTPDMVYFDLDMLQEGKTLLIDSVVDTNVMLCTGLKDKNGVEIYEGDIIRNHHRNYEVAWHGMSAQFQPFYLEAEDEGNHIHSSGTPLMDWNWIHCGDTSDPKWREKPVKYGVGINIHGSGQKPEACEVIGNIYENPELLESPKEDPLPTTKESK